LNVLSWSSDVFLKLINCCYSKSLKSLSKIDEISQMSLNEIKDWRLSRQDCLSNSRTCIMIKVVELWKSVNLIYQPAPTLTAFSSVVSLFLIRYEWQNRTEVKCSFSFILLAHLLTRRVQYITIQCQERWQKWASIKHWMTIRKKNVILMTQLIESLMEALNELPWAPLINIIVKPFI